MNEFIEKLRKYLRDYSVSDSLFQSNNDCCNFFTDTIELCHWPADIVCICSKALVLLKKDSDLYKLIDKYIIYSTPYIRFVLQHYGGPESMAKGIIICGEMLVLLVLKRIDLLEHDSVYSIIDILRLRFSRWGIEKNLTDSDEKIKQYIWSFCTK